METLSGVTAAVTTRGSAAGSSLWSADSLCPASDAVENERSSFLTLEEKVSGTSSAGEAPVTSPALQVDGWAVRERFLFCVSAKILPVVSFALRRMCLFGECLCYYGDLRY